MSTSIPYDPSLALGNIVPADHLAVLEQISTLQGPINAALGELNSSILLKRKLNMTMQDLVNLGIDTSTVSKSLEAVNKQILSAAESYATVSVDALPKIAAAKGKIPQVSDSVESPIDYNKSLIKQLPLSADSMTMDAQYFSFDESGQSSDSSMASMKSFLSESSSEVLGPSRSEQMTTAATAQVNRQRENHDIQGTLVISANCTHKSAAVFAPFIIDVDKGIRAWNEIFPDQMIKTDSPSSIAAIAATQETKAAKYFNLLSGATFGSSFVGMVHVLNTTSTQSSQQMYSTAESLQAQMDVGSWFAKESGQFGVSSSFSDSAKNLLSSQQITSHISLVTMGLIPTIAATDVELAVKQFSNFSPDQMMGQLQTMQNNNAAQQASVAQAADAARSSNEVSAMKAATITSVMSAVANHQDGSNKMLDINSLMTAFTDYVAKAGAGNIGVPITYFLKPITAAQLAQMWVAKYLPRQYVTSAGDDSTPAEPGGADSSGS